MFQLLQPLMKMYSSQSIWVTLQKVMIVDQEWIPVTAHGPTAIRKSP